MPEGRYEGRCAVTFLEDGRRVRLLENVTYFDPAGVEWLVPAEAIVDGASIPRALWSLVGGPFEGKYRDASVIHDWYCDRRNRPWRAVHRVFFDAMITSGVNLAQAKIMYAAVFAGGPRWSDTVVQNNRLDAPRYRSGGVRRGSDASYHPRDLDVENINRLAAFIESSAPSLDEIDTRLEADPRSILGDIPSAGTNSSH